MTKMAEKGLKFDAIITDPPYGTTACKWDSIIPFDKMWACLNNLRKENAPVILFGSEPFSSALRMSNIGEYKYDWVWKKSHAANFMVAKKKPLIKHENIIIFYNKNKTYNPQMEKGNPHLNRSGAKISVRNK
jgi:site-specific DNA-methyltransferase (adenine-specific)